MPLKNVCSEPVELAMNTFLSEPVDVKSAPAVGFPEQTSAPLLSVVSAPQFPKPPEASVREDLSRVAPSTVSVPEERTGPLTTSEEPEMELCTVKDPYKLLAPRTSSVPLDWSESCA